MRRKRGGEACELARRKRNEWSDGGIGARDDVGLGEPNDGVVENERRERFGFAPFRRTSRDARPYQTGCRDAIAKSVVGVFDGGLVVGGGENEAAEGVVGMGGGENSTLETAALFADGLHEVVLIALGEARGRGGFALGGARPARTVGENAVSVKFRGDGGAGNGDRVTVGGTRDNTG